RGHFGGRRLSLERLGRGPVAGQQQAENALRAAHQETLESPGHGVTPLWVSRHGSPAHRASLGRARFPTLGSVTGNRKRTKKSILRLASSGRGAGANRAQGGALEGREGVLHLGLPLGSSNPLIRLGPFRE